jgi:hypothetical protein
MSAADLPRLNADARLILEYAVRAGKLRDDSLAEAIQSLEASDSARNIIDLQNAMNAVVGQIVPMTLVDLRAGRNPFDQRNVHARRRWQIGLSFATLVLIAVIAYYQFLVQGQESALRAYREVVEARGSERITEVRKLVQQGHALAKDSCQRDAYHKARHELRQVADRTVVASTTLFQLSQSSAWPLVDSIGEVASWIGVRNMMPVAMAAASPNHPVASATASQVGPAADSSNVIGDPCDESKRSGVIPPGYPEWLRNVVFDSIDEFCFASKISVDRLSSVDPLRLGSTSYFGPRGSSYDPVTTVEQRMRVEIGWLLPFLYGLLGACVYVMRRLLFDTKAAVVENVVIVLRLALGALAGVAIGWFSASSNGPSTSLAASSFPYMLAFLAGFSIDILFAVLDRLNRSLIDKTHASAA